MRLSLRHVQSSLMLFHHHMRSDFLETSDLQMTPSAECCLAIQAVERINSSVSKTDIKRHEAWLREFGSV